MAHNRASGRALALLLAVAASVGALTAGPAAARPLPWAADTFRTRLARARAAGGGQERADLVAEVNAFLAPNQHVGFLPLEGTWGSYLFYYYMESVNNPENDPLVLWTNGGPGCSSALALFYEMGPFTIDGDTLSLKPTLFGWERVSSMIFLDQPIGTGFSYTTDERDTVHDSATAGEHVWQFMQSFYKRYPQLLKNDFYVTGESYAGKYVPAIAYAIFRHNKKLGVVYPKRYEAGAAAEEAAADGDGEEEGDGRVARHGETEAQVDEAKVKAMEEAMEKELADGEQDASRTRSAAKCSSERGFWSRFGMRHMHVNAGHGAHRHHSLGRRRRGMGADGHHHHHHRHRHHDDDDDDDGGDDDTDDPEVEDPQVINLKGYAIGNGWTRPDVQMESYPAFAHDRGLIDDALYESLIDEQLPECLYFIKRCYRGKKVACALAQARCQYLEDQILDAGFNEYDIRLQGAYDFSNMARFLNQTAVREEFGVGDREWFECNHLVELDFFTDQMQDEEPVIPPMLEAGIRGLFYVGDMDFACNYYGNEKMLRKMKWSGQHAYNKKKLEEWVFEGKVHGLTKAEGPLVYLRVTDSGHLVPMDQPAAALEMLRIFISEEPFIQPPPESTPQSTEGGSTGAALVLTRGDQALSSSASARLQAAL